MAAVDTHDYNILFLIISEKVLDFLEHANRARPCGARVAAIGTSTHELLTSLAAGGRFVVRIDSVMACELLAVALVVYSV